MFVKEKGSYIYSWGKSTNLRSSNKDNFFSFKVSYNHTILINDNSLEGVSGDLSCINKDTSLCKIANIKQTDDGNFAADFKESSALSSKSSKRMLFPEFELNQVSDDLNSHLKYHKRRRSLQATGQENFIRNPVICLTQGSALLFENLSKTHYPAYLKDSLINTNPDFDYS